MTDRQRFGAERGATAPEYALLLAVSVLVLIPAIQWLQAESGTYLLDTGEDIGRGRSAPGTPWIEPAPAVPTWVVDSPTFGPNLVSNGSFETPDIADNAWGAVSAPPWVSSDGRVEIWDGGHNGVESHAGAQHGELNYNRLTTYTQTISVTAGATYRWSVAHRARTTTDEQAEVVIDGTVVGTMQSPFSWTEYQGVFIASSSTVTLELRSVFPDSGLGNLIDDIRIQEIT